ncbi:di-trans,poly-cis-decaprenylcistransferase [Candidatus Beckwithbacteria bacterium]|nr:di-trans,poly-cis-decaprenylcistransferase [Candidatus Beckwithbacteria bacterium]
MNQLLPQHVAFIVDGNRRWATLHKRSAITGHSKVANQTIDDLVFHCLKLGIPYVTFWAFSTENWKRGRRFCNSLFKLLEQVLQKNVDKYNQAGIRLNTIGDLSQLPPKLVTSIEKLKYDSRNNTKLVVTIALNYGGRDEIVRAIKKLVQDKSRPEIAKLTEADFNTYLDTIDLPDPDLIIRTGGAQRLSGYLLWQSQYAEFYFTDVLMPDFDTKEFDKALADFAKRQRRFGA